MAKRKAAKNTQAVAKTAPEGVEPLVVALAGQLGALLGRIRGRADGLLENDIVRQQVSQIRDGATQLMERVNSAGSSVAKSATGLLPAKKAAKKAKKAKKSAASRSKGRSGGVVDAPGKRHRRPPPEELFDKRLGEPMGMQMGQKPLRRRGRGDRS